MHVMAFEGGIPQQTRQGADGDQPPSSGPV